MFNSNFYTVKKREKGEKIEFEKAYLRQNKHSVQISFELQGTKSEQRFLKIGAELETTFSGDLMDRQQLNGFIIYTIAFQKHLGRISVLDVKMAPKGLQLMETVFWDFGKEPHMMISGGTRGGKSVLLFTLILALIKFANLYICDPKHSDLSNLVKYDVFKGQVYYDTTDIVNCVINAWKVMNKRYEFMNADKNSRMGKDYSDYGMRPTFIVIDEVSALVAELSALRGSTLYEDYETAIQQIAQKGGQAGVYLILSLQKAGAEAIPLAVRDQLMKRVTVGILSQYGYAHAFGQEANNKEFKTVKQIDGKAIRGRGYIGNFGEIIEEFYAPFVPFDEGFDFFEEYAKLESIPLDEYDVIDTTEVVNVSAPKPLEYVKESVYTRLELAKELEVSETTIQRITEDLASHDIYFDKNDQGHYVYGDNDRKVFSEIISNKEQKKISFSESVSEIFD
ncbi:transposase [Bacilli bacterium]|nr:transposase [Bacilli bacterium]